MADVSRNIPVLVSAARTATINSADQKNISFTGCHIVIDMTAITATGSIVFELQALDALSGQYYGLLTSAAVTTVSTVVLKVYPGLTAAANLIASDGLPMDFRVVATHANAVSMTYSVSANMIK